MPQVVLKNLKKSYPGGALVVNDVSLTCEDREFLVLVGPSGCGKSTTLRMIAGLEEVSSGEIRIDGVTVTHMKPMDRDIAMVFQNYALYPHMSAYENMAFGLKLRKVPKNEIKLRVLEAADILGIRDLLGRKPKQLSGGQRQRIAVGRAIVRKPKVFLFDEPLSNLDAKMRVQMRAEISKLHHRLQATMIYVTHDQVEAMTMGDRIVVMKDGLIQQVGDPISLYERPKNKFVAGFIGSPGMNFMEGRIALRSGACFFEGDHFMVKVSAGAEAALSPYAGRPLVLGVRPEDIHLKAFATKAAPGNTITASVQVIERLGPEAYVYLCTGKVPFIARIEHVELIEVNKDIEIVLDMGKAHYFDPQSGESIDLGEDTSMLLGMQQEAEIA
jgi:multiple sugar transport system ATP-binding protein